MLLNTSEARNLTLIAAVMLPEALARRIAAAFERIAGCPFLNNHNVSFQKKLKPK